MKNIISLLIGAAAGFALAFFGFPQASVSSAPAPAPSLPSVTLQPIPVDEHLEALTQINPTATKTPARDIRKVVYHFEALVDAGSVAVRAITNMITSGRDLDYELNEKITSASSLPFWSWHAGQPVLSGLVLPPSFRLGLAEVLAAIGGEAGETALVQMMETSPRAVEVAYLAQLLEKLAPGKYSAASLVAAKRLLADPATNAPLSALDAKGNAALYNLLAAQGDNSQTAAAQAKLVANGRLDMDAAQYLIATLKGQAVTELAKIYPGANSEDKNRIAGITFPYVGATPEANQIFKDWVLNSTQDPAATSISARSRSLYIQMLCGGNVGPFQADPPTERAVIDSRIGLLKELDGAATEARLKQAIAQSLQCLQGR